MNQDNAPIKVLGCMPRTLKQVPQIVRLGGIEAGPVLGPTLKLLGGIKPTKIAMTEPSAKYNIYSKLDDGPNVGIWWLLKEQEQQGVNGQPVRINADLVEWVATPPVGGGGRHRLGPGPYKYSIELEGQVLATNNPDPREWFLRPANEEDTYLISVDEKSKYVWTAAESGKPVKIEPFTGDQNQLFKIVPIFEE
ncbi:hypothetical protein L210DRAFT_195712 [Boletus edulis BED1]|uniref:Uncharacterized protein n=1 Tax=Boletus edulis BED1 TaxID=1328754 RepID=A0AAD4BGK7_BOLED|nr:hypothetical protein L210DRAFT_195712 [Boletus edulis BED1]